MLCHFFKGNWLAFHEEAREHLLRTLVWCIKRREKELRVNVVSCFVFIWKFLMSIKGSEEKSHWNSIQELPTYTEFFKDVWLDPLKMTKTMNCVAPGFIILPVLLSLLPWCLGSQFLSVSCLFSVHVHPWCFSSYKKLSNIELEFHIYDIIYFFKGLVFKYNHFRVKTSIYEFWWHPIHFIPHVYFLNVLSALLSYAELHLIVIYYPFVNILLIWICLYFAEEFFVYVHEGYCSIDFLSFSGLGSRVNLIS